MERHQRTQIGVREDVAVQDDEGLLDPGCHRSEPDRPGRVQRLRLDGVSQLHPRRDLVRVLAGECLRPVAERENRLFDAVCRQVTEHTLDHRNLDDRQQLFRRRVREGPETRSLAAYEDDGLHFVVEVVLAAVVVVVVFDFEVVEVVDVLDVVLVLVLVLDVVDEGGAVVTAVVEVEACSCAWSSDSALVTAALTVWLGAGTLCPLGANPTTKIGRFAVNRVETMLVTFVPVVAVRRRIDV